VPGEDPLLTSRFAVAYVKGLQQIRYDEAKPDRPMQVAACCKHFVANSLEMWQNHSRHDFDAVVSAEDMRDYYLPPFIACVKEAGVAGIMCSYNAVNGIPSCVSEPLLKDLLRKDWGFDGYVTSDCGALTDIDTFHHYTRNPIQTAALAANATTNLNCGRVYKHFLPMALEQGFVTAATIRENLAKLVTVQMKLGLFDQPKSKGPFADLGIGEIDSLKHQSLALEAAEQSIVLLQNHASSGNQSTLPLSPGQRIAVIGPHSNASTAFLGNYHGWRCPSGNDEECMTTPFAAIAERNTGGTTVSALGCKIDGIFENIAEAVEVAKSADTIVLLVGLDNSQEEEGLDRIHTTLPGHQQQLVQAILAIGNPQTVLVLVNGGALSLGPYLRETPAIVEAAYGGQAAAEALARVLFGDSNPSGRLAATMYPPEYVDQMPLTDMGLRRGLGRTYMFYRGQAEFPFGHGLSYSNWTVDYEYSYEPGPNGGQLRLLAHVTNQGPWPGRQSLLLLAVRPNPKKQQARQKLVDYGGTAKMLEVGEQQTLFFSLDENPFEGNLGLVVLEPNGQRRSLGTWDNLTQGETSMLRKSL
jgi:beta-D-xylosidase 4